MSDHNSKTKNTILMRLAGLTLLAASILVVVFLLPIINNELQLIKVVIGLASVGGGVAGFMQLITGENYIEKYFKKNKKQV